MALFNTNNTAHVSPKLKGKARLRGESFTDYRKRRRKEDKLVKNYLKGELVYYPGGKRSVGMFMFLCTNRKVDPKTGDLMPPKMSVEVADKVIKTAQGTLKGNPTGNLQSNGLPERHKPVIKAKREI